MDLDLSCIVKSSAPTIFSYVFRFFFSFDSGKLGAAYAPNGILFEWARGSLIGTRIAYGGQDSRERSIHSGYVWR